MKSRGVVSQILFTLGIAGIDIAAFTGAFVLAVQLRYFLGVQFEIIPDFMGDTMHFLDLYFMPILFLIIFSYEGLYTKRLPFIDEVREIIKAIFILTVVFFAIVTVGKILHLISRMTILLMVPLSITLIVFARYWGKLLLYKLNLGNQNLLIFGQASESLQIFQELSQEKILGYRFVGFVPINKSEQTRFVDLKKASKKMLHQIGNTSEIFSLIHSRKIDCVLFACPSADRQMSNRWIANLHRHVKHVLIIPEMNSGSVLNSELFHLFVNQLFLIKMRNSLKEWPARLSKMALDWIITISLAPFYLPILFIIALAVKTTSAGPAFFTQKRVGKGGRIIRVYKFRSMYADAEARLEELLKKNPQARKEWKINFKLKNDPRITPIGSFLRKTSLDELPQLFNVLKGEMSLVGPRPVTETELNTRYKEKKEFYLLVRPGITGLWQVSGRSDVSYEQRVNMDTWYVFNWSPWIDLVIFYKTIGVVLKKRGAY